MNRIAKLISNSIKHFVKGYKALNNTTTDWNEPVIAFADASDPLFPKLKIIVDKTHKLPSDFLNDAKTVISFFIPFKKEVVLSNVDGRHCSKEWAIAYVETNRLIVDLNKHISQELEKQGFKSVILPPTHNFDEKKLISSWSHKHVGFIAGLGKFGLHHQLITEKGCCGRLGSLITNAEIKPTERIDKEFCLYKLNQECANCVENCKFDALKIDSFNKQRCYKICLSNAEFHKDLGFADVCGKCICITPCSFSNPSR